MAYAVKTEASEVTPEMYDAVAAKVDVENNPPEGLIVHTAGQAESGWLIFDVWDSREAFERFSEERLRPAIQAVAEEHGMAPTPPNQSVYELHHLVRP